MYLVTGGAGFIGSHVVRALNASGRDDILVVDDLTDGDKFRNLADLTIADYMDRDEFRHRLFERELPAFEGILHQGACAVTTETDGQYMMGNNFSFSKELFEYAVAASVPFVYASSAATYGLNHDSAPVPENEKPINVYAYSKLLFDQYVRRHIDRASATVVGLRYFNVYGPGERHKGPMASMVSQLCGQLRTTGVARLFAGTDGYGDGEQLRDFVCVIDVAQVNLELLDGAEQRSIVNVGAGKARGFNDVANTLIDRLGKGSIEYVPFPDSLRGKYQSFTEADLASLRDAGCDHAFLSLEDGIAASMAGWEAEGT